MKNNSAREMILALVLCFLTLAIVLTHFIFINFHLKLLLWVILVFVFASAFVTFYIIKFQKGVFYTFVAMFTINAIFHLIMATYAFKTYDSSHVLESTCSLLYLICATTFFLSYLFFLSSTTLEVRKLYKLGVYGLYISSAIAFIQFIITIFACNEGIYPWEDVFRPIAFATMFFLHGIISLGDYIKNQFKFLQNN